MLSIGTLWKSFISLIVIVLNENRELPLFGSGGFRFLWDTKLDAAMVAFVGGLFTTIPEKTEHKDFMLPYRMAKGKVEDGTTSYSVK